MPQPPGDYEGQPKPRLVPKTEMQDFDRLLDAEIMREQLEYLMRHHAIYHPVFVTSCGDCQRWGLARTALMRVFYARHWTNVVGKEFKSSAE